MFATAIAFGVCLVATAGVWQYGRFANLRLLTAYKAEKRRELCAAEAKRAETELDAVKKLEQRVLALENKDGFARMSVAR